MSHSFSIRLTETDNFFRKPHPVIRMFLEGVVLPGASWFTLDAAGEADTEAAKRRFLNFHKQDDNGDDLIGLMPLMRYQPKEGSKEEMLLRVFDPDVHGHMDLKDENAFRARRASLGPTHDAVRGLGCSNFYGGYRVRLDAMALIKGPLFAGEGCDIRASAKAIGPAILGDDTLLNTSSVFVRSIMGNRTQVDDGAKMKDALIGSDVFIKAGAVLEHRNGLHGDAIVVEDRRRSDARLPAITIRRAKMGCIVGDSCEIGPNAVIGAGSILLPGCHVPRGLVLPSGIYDQDAIDTITTPRRHYSPAPRC